MNPNTSNPGRVYLSTYFVGEPHCDYPFKVDFTVCFTNEDRNISKQIITQDGNILDFPGVEYTDVLTAELGKDNIAPVVKYGATFEALDGNRFRMIWTVRPDGRFWMDSWGFGAEDYEWVELYSYIDENGRFSAPFRLYSIGYRKFADAEKQTGETL